MRRFPSVMRAALLILVVGSLTAALVATLPSAAQGAVVAPRFSAIGATPTIPDTSLPPAESRQMDDLTPLGSAQPHGHAPIRVDGERPHISGQAGLNLSTNWSGEVDSGAGASFDGVEGDWVVPSVQASAADGFSATWLGIDGVDTSSLIQMGTAQDSGGLYYAWAEFLPGAEEEIGNSSGPAPVAPGDQMDAQILETSPGVFTMTLDDITQDWSFSGPFDYSTPGITAEWIEEDPSSSTGLLPSRTTGALSSPTWPWRGLACPGRPSLLSTCPRLREPSPPTPEPLMSPPIRFPSSTALPARKSLRSVLTRGARPVGRRSPSVAASSRELKRLTSAGCRFRSLPT